MTISQKQTYFGYFLDGLGGGIDETYPYASWPHCMMSTCDLHLRAHRYIAGTMVGSNPAADPLFYLLHGYADLIFERWIRAQMITGTFDIFGNIAPNTNGFVGQDWTECQGYRHVSFCNPMYLT
jgi:hypothetical protein